MPPRLLALGFVLVATASAAAPAPSDLCKAGQHKAVGGYFACRQQAAAKRVTTDSDAKYAAATAACDAKLAKAWAALAAKAAKRGATCPAGLDGVRGPAARCSDTSVGLVNGVRFEDSGDGTVIDHATGLQWEKKRNLDQVVHYDDPHDADNAYAFGTTPGLPPPDGSAFTDFIFQLNGASDDGATITGCFAGHCDWRLPTIVELASIIDPTVDQCGTGTVPCIDPIFGPTRADYYRSATSLGFGPASAWLANFYAATLDYAAKDFTFPVRAVRTLGGP